MYVNREIRLCIRCSSSVGFAFENTQTLGKWILGSNIYIKDLYLDCTTTISFLKRAGKLNRFPSFHFLQSVTLIWEGETIFSISAFSRCRVVVARPPTLVLFYSHRGNEEETPQNENSRGKIKVVIVRLFVHFYKPMSFFRKSSIAFIKISTNNL